MSKSSASWTNAFFKCSKDSVTIQKKVKFAQVVYWFSILKT